MTAEIIDWIEAATGGMGVYCRPTDTWPVQRKELQMKKRIFSMVLCTVLVLTLLAGCGGSASSSSGDKSKKYKMAYVVSTVDEFLGFLRDDVVAAAEEKGVELEVLYAGEDSSKMIDCVNAANTAGNDAVLINLNEAENAHACIEAAGDMKVVFINRVPDDFSYLGENVAAVASDENTSGVYQGEYLADLFNKEGKKEVSYVLLRGTEGLVHTDKRTDGALNTLKDAGIKLTEAAVVHGNYNRMTARDAFADLLEDGLKFDCIISNNDAMALGAIIAMNNAGMDPKAVPIVGIDATDDGIEALKTGELNMTVFQSHKGQAAGSVQAAINMLEGKDIAEGTECEVSSECPYVLYYPFVPVTADTLDQIQK